MAMKESSDPSSGGLNNQVYDKGNWWGFILDQMMAMFYLFIGKLDPCLFVVQEET